MIWKILILLLVFLLACYSSWALWPLSERADLVPNTYAEGRQRFLEGAKLQGAELDSYQIAAPGPDGEPLFIDVAWIGTKEPQKMFLHISGTHGVEGFSGSVIQGELLKEKLAVPEDTALVFLHGLNPYGMAHYRRFNESNADLNRNFMFEADKYKGAPEAYEKVRWFLNPESSPCRIDLFFPQALYLILRHGFVTLKQAIAGGQYEYPKGIYFGGSKMEESSRFLDRWLQENTRGVQKLFVIEVHTGLGESGVDTLFWPLALSDPKTKKYEDLLDEKFSSDAPDEGVGFKTAGDLQGSLPARIPEVDVAWILQEFGAYGPVFTLRALRNENAYHQYGEGKVDHWSKKELLEAFSPGNLAWQEKVLSRGRILFDKFFRALEKEKIQEEE